MTNPDHTAPADILRASGGRLLDSFGREIILRGVNLGGSSKLPFSVTDAPLPANKSKSASEQGAENFHHPTSTADPLSFTDHQNLSFTGRPFPLSQADEHFGRLAEWGMNHVRLVVTWEAIEHAGPGLYDEEYIDYIRAVCEKAADHRILIWIDPHQDVWSRFTGGDGAPGWTIESAGMDIGKIPAVGAGLLHHYEGDEYPAMSWPTNYNRLGAATMFTLFFAGEVFAPQRTIDGENIGTMLRRSYIGSMRRLARALKGLPNLIGFGSMNEPGFGYIGFQDLSSLKDYFYTSGMSPTPFQSMVAASGRTVYVPYTKTSVKKHRLKEMIPINLDQLRLWRDDVECLWKEAGVWKERIGAAKGSNVGPQLLQPDYFSKLGNRSVDFSEDFLKPFINDFIAEIRKELPQAVLFLEGFPGHNPPHWSGADADNAVNACHWYDDATLFTKRYRRFFAVDAEAGRYAFGRGARKKLHLSQIERKRAAGRSSGLPTLIGEFGVPFNLQNGKSYRTGNFSKQEAALDEYYNYFDSFGLGASLWNYTADNTNRHGDRWNLEDLSVFSQDQKGGRGTAGFVRPYPARIAGNLISFRYNRKNAVFALRFTADLSMLKQEVPTEIVVPPLCYPKGFTVEITALKSSAAFEADASTRPGRVLIRPAQEERAAAEGFQTPFEVLVKLLPAKAAAS
ncbi:MAG: cellulase family glycosylhydrolase [Spirochaetales bacterium]|nr:cellulase family glycosylhydrolase [Spirochaetales bacterium]MCF7937380.1 cellulase family glycosylhydrolase [Spirochaetales bacterium]